MSRSANEPGGESLPSRVHHLDPGYILLSFGSALIVVGLLFKTPFPVQPICGNRDW